MLSRTSWAVIAFLITATGIVAVAENRHSTIGDEGLRRRSMAACSARATEEYCNCIYNHHTERFTPAEMRAHRLPQSEVIAAFAACSKP